MSYREEQKALSQCISETVCELKVCHLYLILFIQDYTEDLCTVSFLDAGPPRNHENIIILGVVALNGQSLLCVKITSV